MADVNSTATTTLPSFTPAAQDMACAQMSLMLMALVPIFVGSFKSIRHQTETHNNARQTGQAAETMTGKDAMMFPLIASCALFGFYTLIKYFPNAVNYVITAYFFVLGVFAIYRLLQPAVCRIFPARFNSIQYTFLFGSDKIHNQDSDKQAKDNDHNENEDQEEQEDEDEEENEDEYDERSDQESTAEENSDDTGMVPATLNVYSKFTHSDIVAFVLSTLFGVWYFWTKHWLANNAFGLAFALNGIELLPINTIKIGTTLLCGLFFYDVFWVFCTDVMVSVAKKFDAPIKIMFPQDFLIHGFWGKNFTMLGLGDIVIPGIFIAFLLRFDHSLKRGRNTYFWSCFLAYIIGLSVTFGVMTHFKHAQPALLYLVPCCILIPFIVAFINGDVGALLKYHDHPPAAIKDKQNSSSSHTKSTRSNSTRASSKKVR